MLLDKEQDHRGGPVLFKWMCYDCILVINGARGREILVIENDSHIFNNQSESLLPLTDHD